MGDSMGLEKVLKNGEILFREGDVGDEMYLIKAGRVKIVKRVGEETKTLAVLSEGDFFGEMAVIDGSPRSATSVSDGETHLITFDKIVFRKKIGEEPLIEYIVTELARRLRKADEQIKFLMIKSDDKRLIAFLITKAQEEGIKQDDGTILLNFQFVYDAVAPVVGIGVEKLKRMMDQLIKGNLVDLRNDKIIVRSTANLEEYLRYVSLKEKFGE